MTGEDRTIRRVYAFDIATRRYVERRQSVLPLGGNRLAIVNDTNFGSTGRNPDLPDPSDLIVVRVPGLHGDDEDQR